MGIRLEFDAGDTPVAVFESNYGDYVYYEDYQTLEKELNEYKEALSETNDMYVDMKTQFESLKDAIANLYRDY